MHIKAKGALGALVAVVAMGVVTAPAFASLPQFVPAEGVKWPIKLESKSTGKWQMAGASEGTMTCTGSKLKGEITGPKSFSVTVEMEGCKGSQFFEDDTCHSEGRGEGDMVLSGTGKLVYLSKSKKEVATILTTPDFECGRALWESGGGELIPLEPVNVKGSEIKFTATGNGKGTMNVKEYENEKGEKKIEELEWGGISGFQKVSAEVVGTEKLTSTGQFTLEA
jgi:hypothetical protein